MRATPALSASVVVEAEGLLADLNLYSSDDGMGSYPVISTAIRNPMLRVVTGDVIGERSVCVDGSTAAWTGFKEVDLSPILRSVAEFMRPYLLTIQVRSVADHRADEVIRVWIACPYDLPFKKQGELVCLDGGPVLVHDEMSTEYIVDGWRGIGHVLTWRADDMDSELTIPWQQYEETVRVRVFGGVTGRKYADDEVEVTDNTMIDLRASVDPHLREEMMLVVEVGDKGDFFYVEYEQ